jgi:hypothetical protein
MMHNSFNNVLCKCLTLRSSNGKELTTDRKAKKEINYHLNLGCLNYGSRQAHDSDNNHSSILKAKDITTCTLVLY